MLKHITVITTDGPIEVRGEMLFDPQEGTLHILGGQGSQATFNWAHVQFFVVQACEGCDDE